MNKMVGSNWQVPVIRRGLSALKYRRDEWLNMPGAERALPRHIEGVIDWLLRAQSATPDDGVAESYNPLTHSWYPSYPETTGYIICSILRAADAGFDNNGRLIDAARRMGRWLLTTQLDDGAFPGGNINHPNRAAAVFNTGQILKGLTDLIERRLDESGEFVEAANRAADYMITTLDPDGCWRRGISKLTTAPVHAYNVRAAWALVRFGKRLSAECAVEAGVANAEWVCTLQDSDAWFEHMNFDNGIAPLTHTIAYTIQGLIEIGALVDNPEFIRRGKHAAEALFALQDSRNGSLPGQFEKGWRPVGRFTSNTGNAQMAIIGHRLASLTGDQAWRAKAMRATAFCKKLQELDHPDVGRRGAVRGSFPGHIGYGRYWYMNWTQKFFLDALLCEMNVEII